MGTSIGREDIRLRFKKKAVLNAHTMKPVSLDLLLQEKDVKMRCTFCRNADYNAAEWREARKRPMSDWETEEDLGQITNPFELGPEDVETIDDLDLLPDDDDEYGGDDDGED